jgi:shikimate dehydrogenase
VTTRQATTRRAAVIGSPIEHSLSPALHRAAYAELGLDWSYDAIELAPGELADFVAGLDRAEWAGLSVTMPFKREAWALAGQRSEIADLIGVANTLTFASDGTTVADNTDVPGLMNVLKEHVSAAPRSVTILGAGATAGSSIVALSTWLRAPTPMVVVARRPDDQGDLVSLADRLGLSLSVAPWSQAQERLDADLVIATTPTGATDTLEPPRHRDRPATLIDVVYAPWPTMLATRWELEDLPVVGGLELLVAQALLQVQLMTGRTASEQTLRQAGEAALAHRTF